MPRGASPARVDRYNFQILPKDSAEDFWHLQAIFRTAAIRL
jgi:hypothetical protein